MKIIYDYQAFSLQQYGGISRYFYLLMEYFDKNKDIDYELIVNYSNNAYLREGKLKTELNIGSEPDFENFLKGINFKGKGRLYKFFKKLAHDTSISNKEKNIEILKKGNFDIFHPTYYDTYFLEYIGKKPFVLTFHDMTHEIYAEHFIAMDDRTHERKRLLAEKASKIIAISKQTKKDIINFYGIEDSKIEVIYHGNVISPHNYPPIKIDGLPANYLLYVGNRSFYKNFYMLIFAIHELLKSKNLFLVCIGGGKFSENEINLFNSLGITDRIMHFSVNDNKLVYAYQNAKAFIYPSLYEGFGMPIIESFACNCPVICSNVSSFPEIAQNAAVFFDPKDITSIRKSVDDVLTNKDLKEEIKRKGKERAEIFSVENTASKTIDLYSSLL